VLSLEPLAAVPVVLHVAHRDVVSDRVSEDVPERARLRDVDAAAADDDGELDLPVEPVRDRRWMADPGVRPDDGVRVLAEERRVLRELLRLVRAARARPFGEVLAVVPPDAEDVALRARDRGEELRLPDRGAPLRALRRV